MAISVDYSVSPFLITIPKADTSLITGTQRSLTVDQFWLLLRDYTDNENTMAQPKLYRRTPATASTPSITEVDETYYALQFEDGLYSVNIINGNTNIREVEVKNQVSVNTNNTTGFIDPTFLELGLFAGAVSIDTTNGVSGTGRTGAGGIIGTRTTPSNNLVDAETIAQTRGIRDIKLMRNLTITSENVSEGYRFVGDSPYIQLDVQSAANFQNCEVELLTVTGELDGFNLLKQCIVGAVTEFSGFAEKCALTSSMTLNGDSSIFESYSNLPGSTYPSVIVASHSLVIRDFRGSIGLSGMTGGVHSTGVYGGRLVIEADCTGGTVHVRGNPYTVTDLSGGLVTIVDQTDSEKVNDLWSERGLDSSDPTTYTLTGTTNSRLTLLHSGDPATSTVTTRS